MRVNKILVISILCAIVFTFSSCANTIDEKPNESLQAVSTRSDKSSREENIFDTYLYDATEGGNIVDGQHCTSFDEYLYYDSNAEPKQSLILNGTEYTMSYETSAIFAMSDVAVHTYTIDGVENARVCFDIVDGKMVKCTNIPHEEKLSSEKECLDFIKTIYPSSSYSSYDYKCMTHSYYVSDSELRSTVEDGFLLPDENRDVKRYFFFFTQSIGSIKTDNHITAIIRDDTFTLEVFNIDYNFDLFQPLLDSLSTLDDELTAYIRDNCNPEYEFSSCDLRSRRLIIKDGAPYIVTSLNVWFTQTFDTESSSFVTIIDLISGMKDSCTS